MDNAAFRVSFMMDFMQTAVEWRKKHNGMLPSKVEITPQLAYALDLALGECLTIYNTNTGHVCWEIPMSVVDIADGYAFRFLE